MCFHSISTHTKNLESWTSLHGLKSIRFHALKTSRQHSLSLFFFHIQKSWKYCRWELDSIKTFLKKKKKTCSKSLFLSKQSTVAQIEEQCLYFECCQHSPPHSALLFFFFFFFLKNFVGAPFQGLEYLTWKVKAWKSANVFIQRGRETQNLFLKTDLSELFFFFWFELERKTLWKLYYTH